MGVPGDLADFKFALRVAACDVVLSAGMLDPMVRYGATGELALHDVTSTELIGPWWSWTWPTRKVFERVNKDVVAVWMKEVTPSHMCQLAEALLTVPMQRVVLLGYGSDGGGNPFSSRPLGLHERVFPPRNPWLVRRCALDLIELPQVVAMHIGHAEHLQWLRAPSGRWVNETHPKLGYTPSLGVRLQTVFDTAMDRCTNGYYPNGSLSLLFVCNNRAHNTPRPKLTTELGRTIHFRNAYPLRAEEWVAQADHAVVGFSPMGTGPDGFRHWELLALGIVPIVPRHPSMEFLFRDLPVIFHGTAGPDGRAADEPPITHAWLVAQLRALHERWQKSELNMLVLTEGYWKSRLVNWGEPGAGHL